MSGIKRHIEDIEAAYQGGLALCIEAGAIEECEYHPGTYFEGGEPVEAAYKLAARKVKAGEIGGKQGDVTDAVKDAYEDNSGIDYCSSCEKNERD